WVGVSSLARGARDGMRSQKYRRSSTDTRFAATRNGAGQIAPLRGHALGRTDWVSSDAGLVSRSVLESARIAAPVTYFAASGAESAPAVRAFEPVTLPHSVPSAAAPQMTQSFAQPAMAFSAAPVSPASSVFETKTSAPTSESPAVGAAGTPLQAPAAKPS